MSIPANEKEAVAALSRRSPRRCMPIGGGQDLLARMKDYVTQPDRVVNVKKALDATVTPMPGGGLRIGAAMKIVDVAEHAEIGRLYPAVAAAAIEVGTPQIRNQGTVGGNLNQRPRCWYYPQRRVRLLQEGRQPVLLARRARTSSTRIFGDGPSYIVHPSSLAVPFVAYDATFRLLSPQGRADGEGRRLLHDADEAERAQENVLEPDELLTHVILPAPGSGQERPLRGPLQGHRTTGRSRSRRSSSR